MSLSFPVSSFKETILTPFPDFMWIAFNIIYVTGLPSDNPALVPTDSPGGHYELIKVGSILDYVFYFGFID